MNKPPRFLALTATCLLASLVVSSAYPFPSVYPTGTTIYQPDQTWNGYTVFDAPDGQGAVLIDMNGNGGSEGYGFANPAAPDGQAAAHRDFSRVLEFNPVTFEKVWEYSIGGTAHRNPGNPP